MIATVIAPFMSGHPVGGGASVVSDAFRLSPIVCRLSSENRRISHPCLMHSGQSRQVLTVIGHVPGVSDGAYDARGGAATTACAAGSGATVRCRIAWIML